MTSILYYSQVQPMERQNTIYN